MYGVVNGVYFCNNDRDAEINKRLEERNMPSAPLQPQFSQRPVSTKYALLPIIDRRAKATVPLKKCANFNVSKVFALYIRGKKSFRKNKEKTIGSRI